MKKGQVVHYLPILVLALIFIIAASILTGKMIEAGGKSSKESACRKCIELANSKTSKLIKVKCECPREELLIKFKDISDDGKTINQNKAHKILADAMMRCLRRFHDGDLDPIADFPGVGDDSACRPCYDIVFDAKLRKVMEENAPKLGAATTPEEKAKNAEIYTKYFITNPVPFFSRKINPSSKLTYWEYLFKEAPPDGLDNIGVMGNAALLEGSTVQMKYVRDTSLSGEMALIFGIVGAVIGGVVIIATGGAALAVMPLIAGKVATVVLVGAVAGASTGGLAALATIGIEALHETSDITSFGDLQNVDTFLLAFPDKNAFKDCSNCEDGAGGIMVLPPDFDYSTEWVVGKKKWPVCDIVI